MSDSDRSGLPPLDDLDTGTGGNIDDNYRLVEKNVSCENCVHKPVCAVYKGIEPMFREWAAGDSPPPFDLTELAVICDHYENEDQ